jgi:hypothetical protein
MWKKTPFCILSITQPRKLERLIVKLKKIA